MADAVAKQHDHQSHPGVKNFNILGVAYPAKYLREIQTNKRCDCLQDGSKIFTVTLEEEEDDDDKEGKKKKTWKEVINPCEYHFLSVKYILALAEEMILEDDMKEKMTVSSAGSGSVVPSPS